MPRFFSGEQIAKIFSKKYGFERVSVSGSHLKMRKHDIGTVITVIIPLHNEVLLGTFRSILNQAKINKDDFYKKSRE